ncbi:hypothetical protein [Paenibacillus alkalitolerans]|uniref:hypothetical protein n=1 Tax=Paenibacillus alkalitolerans TaxID=2799335 RepID=UPI0018F46175|nr:hypothetical protein [Paenibacillus alkalitolerans]
MSEQRTQWVINGQAASNTPKVPYVGTWANFSKLEEKEKASLFNAMRAELIASGKMENKGS